MEDNEVRLRALPKAGSMPDAHWSPYRIKVELSMAVHSSNPSSRRHKEADQEFEPGLYSKKLSQKQINKHK